MSRVDTHHHLLPGVDDGCRTLADSLAAARFLVAQGYGRCFCTPHVGHPSFADLTMAELGARVENLRGALAEAGIALEIRPGGELNLQPDTPERVKMLGVPTFGFNTQTVLIDLWEPDWPPWATRAVEWLQQQGYTLILAHPERMAVLHERPEFIEELARMGLKFQATFAPLAGTDTARAQELAERYLQEGRYWLLGSDAHGPATLAERYPGLARAEALVGAEAVRTLVEGNAAALWP